MIKVKVVERFRLKDFDKLKNIKRASIEVYGELLPNDTFECDEEMVKYLSGDNAFKKSFVKVVEILPETKSEEIVLLADNKELEKLGEEIMKHIKPKKKKSKK